MEEIRALIDRYKAPITLVSVVLIFIALLVVMFSSSGSVKSSDPRDDYFFDLTSTASDPREALFRAPGTSLPPIPVPSGAKMPDGTEAGVLARIYACGECSKSSIFIAHVETFTPEARERRLNPNDQTFNDGSIPPEQIMFVQEKGRLLMTLEDRERGWVEFMSPEGQTILLSLNERCPKGDVRPCHPEDVEGE